MVKLRKCRSHVAPIGKMVDWLLLEPSDQKSMRMYLHFYEWKILFDEIRKGQRIRCDQQFFIEVDNDQNQAVVKYDDVQLVCNATIDGADLLLTLTNNTSHEWPEISGIIPCFNPGNSKTNSPQVNALFSDDAHTRTFFLGREDLELLREREIHFNDGLRSAIDQFSPDSNFVFSSARARGRWPTSETNAKAGILIRESEDGKWVTGIGWEDFLFVQGHNPLKCMHVCVRVGPLKRLETKRIRGKIYLFEGKKEDCLNKYLNDFATKKKY